MKKFPKYGSVQNTEEPQETTSEGGERYYKKVEDFEDILEIIGSYGKYQKMFLYAFLNPFSFILPLFVMNTVFLYSVPDHWCHVQIPPEYNNTSLGTWKRLTIPREIGPDGLPRFSQCEMFASLRNHTRVPCQHGWDYDRSQFEDTMPAHFNWVCNNSSYIAKALVAGIIGCLIGTLVFGWAGDKWGRKPIFFVCCSFLSIFRYVSIWLPGNFIWYQLAEILLSSAYPMTFLILYSIAAEITDKDVRYWVYSLRFTNWVLGICFLSFVAFLTPDWFLLGTITSLPLLLIFLVWNFIPESPRWLLTQNRIKEAEKIMNQIATTNSTIYKFREGELCQLLIKVKEKQDRLNLTKERSSIWALFSRPRLAWHTILISISSTANVMIYYGITFRATSLSGNQFVNFFLLCIVELPAGWLGGYFAERLGRRWTQVGALFASAVGFGLTIFGTECPDWASLVVPSLMLSKFFISTTSVIFPLQAAEIFPTQHRTMGNGFAMGFGQIVNLGTPYILLLAQTHTSFTYGAFLVASIVGMIAASFLPETMHLSLPETIEEANSIGKGVPYWSIFPKSPNPYEICLFETEE